MNLIEFMRTDDYIKYLDDLDNYLPEKIDRKSELYDVVVDLLNDWLSYSSVSIDELNWLILNHRRETINYIVKKNFIYTEPDGGEDDIINERPGVYFPISHLIEYYLLLKNSDVLCSYIKKNRIPKAKQYTKEIANLFSEVKKEN
ncbi:hypothetical protein SMW69_002879 [Salmonella enterica]|uniref:hypothetical protein n=1 Tax=Salmonella enterica TaxID=28901 RepID=UPI0024BF6E4C|nr:hypothetical protein [Salmonella enterica]ELY3362346.1 hypothetical protein [Salmonella enterica]WHW98391.1 hypothetical protein QCX26_15755 [Salmonella enterica subsp. enterica]